ncbi:PAS domain S-box protein [Candidatus Neomarinimicrobiota bacterium]
MIPHEVISATVAVFMDAVIFIIVFIAGTKGRLWWEPGWSFFHAGVGLIFAGDLVELLDILLVANPAAGFTYIIVDGAFLAGYVSMIYGGSRWLPIVIDRRRMERDLKLSEERLTEAQHIASIGSWEWTLHKDEMVCSDEFHRVVGVGYPEGVECTFDTFLKIIHPEDRENVRMSIKKAIENRSSYSVIHRIAPADDTIRYILQQGRPISEGSDEPSRVSGTIQDITEKKQAEDALRESEERYRAVVENVQDGILIINDQYQILFVNPMLCEISGYDEEDLLGKDFRQFVHQESIQPVLDRFSKLARGDNVLEQREVKFIRKDGEVRDVDVSSGILKPQAGQARILGRITDITERKQIEDQLRNLSAHLQSAREETRMTLSREIHDELGQELTALQMDLSWIRKRLPEKHDDLHEKAESMSQLLHSTIQTVKRLSSKLRPPVLDLGVTAALEWEAEEFQEHTGITCQLAITPENVKLEPDLSTVIYRIFQETLTNVTRHAQADKVDAKLEVAGGMIVLEIKDNGIGISDEKISGSRSLGIIGTRERVNQFGGDIHFSGKPGEGTTVTVTIPFKE